MPIEILLVEDTHGDIRLTKEAFRDASSFVRIHVVSDGLQAMAFLRKQGEYARAPYPDLSLLDLELPLMNGRDVLAIIKKDKKLKSVPVFIVTASDLRPRLSYATNTRERVITESWCIGAGSKVLQKT